MEKNKDPLDPFEERPVYLPTSEMEGWERTDKILFRMKEYLEQILWTLNNIHTTLHWMQPPEQREKQMKAHESYLEVTGKLKKTEKKSSLDNWKKTKGGKTDG